VVAVKTVTSARHAKTKAGKAGKAGRTAKPGKASKVPQPVGAATSLAAAMPGKATSAAQVPKGSGATRGAEPAERRHAWAETVAPPPGTGPVGRGLLTLARARDELGLDYDEFEVALQTGEVPGIACGPGQWKVPAAAVAQLRAAPGHPDALLARLRLVNSDEAAKQLGVGRERFVRLARAGYVRPIRWYVNQYRAVVWIYLARELAEFADRSPALLHGPLPVGLREAVAAGEDQRPRGWRARRAAQLVRDAEDVWEEAAVWAALLGPEMMAGAVPDPCERAYLRKLRGELPPGRVGRASAERIRELTTADHPEEIATALLALAIALGRARALRPAPRPSGPEAPTGQLPLLPLPGFSPPAAALPQTGPSPAHSAPAAPPPAAPRGRPLRAPTGKAPGVRRGLRRLLGRRRSAADLAEEPFLHHRHQQPAPAVEDLAARQTAGAGRDG
jgi:hypothetical protein